MLMSMPKHIHRLIAVFLLGGVCSANFSSLAAAWAWQLRREWISANRCENRYRPELHCGGKCVLMQKLKQTDAETPVGGQPPAVRKVVEFLAPVAWQPLAAPAVYTLRTSVERTAKVHQGHVGAIWHPPSMA